MPRIQEIALSPNVSSGTAGGYANPVSFGGELSNLGDMLTRLGDHLTETRRAGEINKAVAGAQNELLDYSFTLQNGGMDANGNLLPPPDPKEHQTLYDAKVKELNDKYLAGLDDTSAAVFEDKFSEMALRESFTVRKNAIDGQKAAISADLTTTLDTLADVYVGSDDVTKPLVQTQALEAIAAAERAGVITPAAAVQARQGFADTTLRAGIRKMIREDPDAALVALTSGEYKDMSPDEQQKWIDTAINQSERNIAAEAARAAAADRAAERAQRDREEATAKQLDTLAADGKLTIDQVKANSGNLAEEDYRRLLGGLTGDAPVRTDPNVYADLKERQVRGEDVSALALQAVRDHLLEPLASDRFTAPDKRPVWAKEGDNYISTAMKPNDFNPSPGAPLRLADALDNWNDWIEKHPDASRTEAQKEYRTIVQQNQLVDAQSLAFSAPLPVYFAGTRYAPDMAKTWADTKKALADNEITIGTYNAQAALIRQWVEIAKQLQPDQTTDGAQP